MSDQQQNADLRRENEELESRNKDLREQFALLTAMQHCTQLRGRVTATYPWAREYDAFISRDLVCGHHPLDPPHYHLPPPD